MRAERRGRARAAARRPRWAAPARHRPVRPSAPALGALDAGLVIVRSQPALREMEADLRTGDRVPPVNGLTCLDETNEPVLDLRLVREIVGVGPRIYYVPGEYLLRRLQRMLGQRLALPAGGARVWWPGLTASSDSAEHPLVLALDSESQTHMLEERARQFDLTRPRVRYEIALIEDARGLAEHGLSQAREQNRAITIERDQAHTRAEQAERALQSVTQRPRAPDREHRP